MTYGSFFISTHIIFEIKRDKFTLEKKNLIHFCTFVNTMVYTFSFLFRLQTSLGSHSSMTTLALSLPGAPNKTLLLCIFALIILALFLLPLLSVVCMYVCVFSGRNLFLSMSTGNSIGCISELNPNPVFLLFFL